MALLHLKVRAVSALLLGASGIVLAGWGPIRQLTFTADNSILPSVGRGLAVMNDNVHIVYADKYGPARLLFYLRSSDRGASFSEAESIEHESEAYRFSVAADSSGGVHLVNCRAGTGLWYRRSSDNGQTWQPAVQLRDLAQNPVLLTSGARNVHVIDYYSDNVLYVNTSTDGGASWGGWRQIAAEESYYGLCGTSGGARLHLTFGYGGSGTLQTYYMRSTDYGLNWSAPKKISTQNQSGPVGIWTDNANNVYLSFTIFGVYRNFRRSTDAGENWLAEQTLSIIVRTVATSPDGKVAAAGTLDDNRVLFIRSTDFGVAWTDTLSISGTESGTREKPHIAVDDHDDAHVVWTSRQTGNVEVFYRFGDNVIGVEEPRPSPRLAASTPFSPNPARAAVTLAGPEPVRLYDRAGLAKAVLRPGDNLLSGLTRGVYFARDRRGALVGKLVKLD